MLIEIWSDIVCPWCAIGKARLEQALEAFEHADQVEVVWRSFELDPQAPRSRDGDLVTHLARKYRTDVTQAQAMMDRMTEAAADDGLQFRFDIARPGNTFDAHRLLHLARQHGVQDAVGAALFTAYLTDGEPIGDVEALQRIGTSAGLDEVEVKDVLACDRFADEVRADEAAARELGVSGVPFFVFDGTYGLSGAYPADALLKVLRNVWSERDGAASGQDADHGHAHDGACADDACVI